MSVICVTEQWSFGSAGGGTSLTAVRGFLVQTSAAADGPIIAQTAKDPSTGLAIPTAGDGHPDDTYRKALLPKVERIGPTAFKVLVEYTNANRSTFPANPLDAPWEVDWDFADSEEEIQVEIDGSPIQNAAGQLFEPGIRETVSDLVLTITRNEAYSEDVSWMIRYANVVNADRFFGALPGQALLKPLRGRVLRQGATKWISRTYQIVFREGEPGAEAHAWWRKLCNRGTYEKKDGKLSEIMRNSMPVTTPVRLTSDGKDAGEGGSETYVEFETKKSAPFAPLKLSPIGGTQGTSWGGPGGWFGPREGYVPP